MAESLRTRLIGASYHDLLVVDSSSQGFNSSVQNIMDGEGTASPLYLSTSKMQYQATTSSTDAVTIFDHNGNIAFQVDTANRRVKAGKRDEYISPGRLDFYHWGVHSTIAAEYHYAMTHGTLMKEQTGIKMGNAEDPDLTWDASSYQTDATNGTWLAPMCYAHIRKAIYIDKIHLWYSAKYDAAGSAVNPTFNAHVMKYNADLSGFSGGDLLNGELVAHVSSGVSPLTAYTHQPRYESLNLDLTQINADATGADAGTCLIPTIEVVTAGDYDIIAKMSIEYHLQ